MRFLVPPTINALPKPVTTRCGLCDEVKACAWKDTELPAADQFLCTPCKYFAVIADCVIVRYCNGWDRPHHGTPDSPSRI